MFENNILKKENDASVDQKSSCIRVLMVEDDILSAHVANRFLTDLGCIVDCADSGQMALELFENNQKNSYYSLILLDISLPDISGDLLACKIKEKEKQLFPGRKPVAMVALTAHNDEISKRSCEAAGISLVLVKPLLKMTAQEILKNFIPDWRLDPTSIKNIELDNEPAIDFAHALAVHDGDIVFIQSALQVILDTLDSELMQLKQACSDENWSAAGVIIHRLQGGTRYFGLVRLDRVCMQFTYILKQGNTSDWVQIYNLLVNEIQKVNASYTKWLQERKN